MKFPFFSWVRYHRSVFKSVTAFTLAIFIWTFLFPVALAAKEAGRPAETQEKRVSDEEELSSTLEEVEGKLGKLEEKLAKGEDDSLEKGDLKKLKKKFKALDKKAKENFQRIEKDLKDKKLPQVILDRHTQAQAVYQTEVQTLLDNLDSVEGAGVAGDRKLKAKKAKEHLEKKRKKEKHRALDPNKLPHRKPEIKKREPRIKEEEFHSFRQYTKVASLAVLPNLVLAQAVSPLPTPEDLVETVEVSFTLTLHKFNQQSGNNPCDYKSL